MSRTHRVLDGEERHSLLCGDSPFVLDLLPDASIDSMVMDPPAGISFMGKTWDQSHGGRVEWVEAFAAIFSECLRVLKPGAHALVWALPRTSHRTALALEDAGFEIRDVLTHHFGTGFPKSLDVSKAIDKAAGADRKVTGTMGKCGMATAAENYEGNEKWSGKRRDEPATDDARRWEGWGTALKPATEHWILARRPLDGTVAANVLEHGTGALNVDGCRVGTAGGMTKHSRSSGEKRDRWEGNTPTGEWVENGGRWPPNLFLTHAAACVPVGTRKVKTSDPRRADGSVNASWGTKGIYGGAASDGLDKPNYAGADGREEIEAWECSPGCPVAEMDAQSGKTEGGKFVRGGPPRSKSAHLQQISEQPRTEAIMNYGDSGGASRFFPRFRYQAKAPARERSAGLPEGEKNTHPTVKSVELMRWLCRLVTPPGGVVLDPFMGSGSTGVACVREGFRFVGIEREKEYHGIAVARISAAEED